MRTVTPAYAAAIGKSETRPASKVTVTWPAGVVGAPTDLSKVFMGITAQADLTTDAPAGTRLIAGYPARNASLVLGGAIKDPTGSMMALFDSWSTSSPLYDFDWTGINGARVVIQQGIYLRGVLLPETYTIMTGYVDGVAVERGTGVVTLSLLDYRPLLSNVPALPMMLASTTYSQAAPGLSSLPFIEYILAANGIYAAPQPRTTGSGCLWYATLHQTLWSQVSPPASANFAASATISDDFTPSWTPGKWAGATAATAYIRQAMTKTASLDTGHSVLMEGWVASRRPASIAAGSSMTMSVAGNSLTDKVELIVDIGVAPGTLDVRVQVTRSGTTVTTATINIPASPTDYQHLMARVAFTGATTATVDLWADATHNTYNLVALGAWAMDATFVELSSWFYLPVDTWQVWADDPAAVPVDFTPTAYLDASLNVMTATPAVEGVTDVWGLFQQLADAELATFGFDEDLIFRFKNRRNFPSVAGRVVTSLIAIKDLAHETIEANRGRTINATVTPYAIQPLAVVWNATQTYAVPAKGTLTIFATLNGPTAFVPPGASGLINNMNPVNQPGPNNSYRGNTKSDGTGPDTDVLNCVMTQLDATTVKIVITNPANHITYVVSPSLYTDMPAGTASLWLVGYPLNAGAALAAAGQQSVTVSATYGAGLPAINLPDSQWRQDQATVQTLCEDVLADYVVPRPQLGKLTIVGDAALQLGDRVTLQDRGELAAVGKPAVPPATMNDDVIITSIHPTISDDGGFVQDITARLIGRPRGWILGVAGRSELGSTTYI
jgi:hypothetical protein